MIVKVLRTDDVLHGVHANDDGHHEEAVRRIAERDYAGAGDRHTRAAWSVLAEPRDGLGPFDTDERGHVGLGLRELLLSAVCYRVAGREDRAERRATEGVALSEDFVLSATPAQEACLKEFAADFRAVAGEGADEAYRESAEAYREAADTVSEPRSVSATPMFRAAADPIKQVGRSLENGEIAVEWEDLHGPDPSDPGRFLAARPEYKRRRLAGMVERIAEEGYLAAPRGTTEYDNDNHRCPECGSEDVNWIADSVLCLRCSTPADRV